MLKPIVWVFVIFICAFLIKQNQKKKQLFGLAFIVFFIFSNSFLIGKIFNWYEPSNFKPKKYDIGILLGGYSKSGEKSDLQLSERGDRLMQTLYLYKTGVIGKILISGGSGALIGQESNEADLTVNYLLKIGIPESSIIRENKSRNTIENAKYSAELIAKTQKNAQILVITSAWHIPRSKMIFEKIFQKNMDFYPTDAIGKSTYDISDYILPDPTALNSWTLINKEWVGLLVDRFRI